MLVAAEKQSEATTHVLMCYCLVIPSQQVAVATDQIQSGDSKLYFLPQYLPSKIQHMMLCVIYRFSKTSLPFLFITLLTVSRGWVHLLASHVLQLLIMTQVWYGSRWLPLCSTLFKLESYITSYWHKFTSSECHTYWLRLIPFIPCWQEYGRDCHLLVSVWNVISCWLSPKMQSQGRVLQKGDFLKIMTVGKLLHFAQPFSDFDGFVAFAVLAQPCWFIILIESNSLGSNICKLAEPVCFSNCFNWRRSSTLWHWSSLFVDQ